jgi:flagellar biosynthesis/type III secretory pathway protein FliH
MGNLARRLNPGRAIPQLAHRRGVIGVHELELLGQGRDIVADARREAAGILADAQRTADAMLAKHREELKRERNALLAEAETRLWKEADAHRQSLETRFAEFTGQLEEQALPVVRQAIATLAGEMPDEQRVRASVLALLAEAGRPADSVLHVNAQDRAALAPMEDKLGWPIEIDDRLEPGACKLISRRGEWNSSFAGRLERLLAIFDISYKDDEGREQASEEKLAA